MSTMNVRSIITLNTYIYKQNVQRLPFLFRRRDFD